MMSELFGKLKMSVVGSFPLSCSRENVRRAFEDQLRAGIDFPSIPQLRDMNMMFLQDLAAQKCGIEIVKQEAWATSPLSPPKSPVATQEFELLGNLPQRYEGAYDGLKVPVTGPITLASVTRVSNDLRAVEVEDLLRSFGAIVREMVKHYCELGVKLVTLDEPLLSYAVWKGAPEDLLIDVIDEGLRGAREALTSIHVCGPVRGLGSLLLKTDAAVIHHEVASLPENLEEYSKPDLERYDKLLGIGCVKTRPSLSEAIRVESIGEVESLLLKAGERFGFERLVALPDCGFKGLLKAFPDEESAQRCAYEKMATMVAAVKRVRARLK